MKHATGVTRNSPQLYAIKNPGSYATACPDSCKRVSTISAPCCTRDFPYMSVVCSLLTFDKQIQPPNKEATNLQRFPADAPVSMVLGIHDGVLSGTGACLCWSSWIPMTVGERQDKSHIRAPSYLDRVPHGMSALRPQWQPCAGAEAVMRSIAALTLAPLCISRPQLALRVPYTEAAWDWPVGAHQGRGSGWEEGGRGDGGNAVS